MYDLRSSVPFLSLNQNNLAFLLFVGHSDAGWSSLVARRAHNPKVVGSNPAPATKFFIKISNTKSKRYPVAGWSSLVARRAHNPKVVGSNPAPATNFTT